MDGQKQLPADILYAIIFSFPRCEIHKYAAVNRQFYELVKRRIDEEIEMDKQLIREFFIPQFAFGNLPLEVMNEILESLTHATRTRLAGEIRAGMNSIPGIVGRWKLSGEENNYRDYIRALGLYPSNVTVAVMMQPYLSVVREPYADNWWIGPPGDEIAFIAREYVDEYLPDGSQFESYAAPNQGVMVILRRRTGHDGIRRTISVEIYRVVEGKLRVWSHVKRMDKPSLLERFKEMLRRLFGCEGSGVRDAASRDGVSATRIYEKMPN